MTDYLLDTDTVIDYLGGVASTVSFLQRLDARGDVLCSCDMVLAEFYAGLLPKDRPAAQTWLPTLLYLPTDAAMAEQAGVWKYAYARQGISLSVTDCLIAATAHGHQAAIVTGNVKDFPQPELTVVPLPRVQRPRRRQR